MAPAVFRSTSAPVRRTLADILDDTVRAHPGAPAIDDGATALTYRELAEQVDAVRVTLAGHGIGVGDRVGVRVPSGTAELYLAILGVLAAGAAYVPVDADDPEERAELVFAEADVCAVLGDGLTVSLRAYARAATGPARTRTTTPGSSSPPAPPAPRRASPSATARPPRSWTPRRGCSSPATSEPIGPDDRVLAGLSVAFDASCEEMWLAWRHGACLVPAARSLVRTGVDLGPWLVEQRITVVSTVPTLAALWPVEALDDVRLLIFGGEACPPELAERLAVEGREVWNTYGPTEATVVACAAQLTGEGPVRIGLPLAGWELAVVDAGRRSGRPWARPASWSSAASGLARYLDAEQGRREVRAAARAGLVRARTAAATWSGPSRRACCSSAAPTSRSSSAGAGSSWARSTPRCRRCPASPARPPRCAPPRAGNQLLVGYVVPRDGAAFDAGRGRAPRLREQLPAALVPLLAVVDALPTRTSGKVDRAALPWPLPIGRATARRPS